MKLKEKATDDNYAEVENQLMRLSRQYWSRYQGDLEDYQSVAREAFVHAYESYENKQSQILTWITIKVDFALQDYIRSKMREAQRLNVVNNYHEIEEDRIAQPVKSDYETLHALAARLNDDCRRVVSLALDLSEPGDKPHNVRKRLREYLRWSGWSVRKINRVFETISNAL